jgi:hypothetical protein
MMAAQEQVLKEVSEMKIANKNREIDFPPNSSDEEE